MKYKVVKTKRKTFRQAVESTPEIANCYQPGLQALDSKYRNRIDLTDTRKCEGSLDIDTCTKAIYPQANRWDYALSYKSKVYFIEFHSAKTDEASTVLRKLQWLKDWLQHKAPEIKKMQATEHAFVWVQSNDFDIYPGSSQAKRLATARLRPVSKFILK